MKDPYLKPVIFGGLFIAILSLIFAPGIILWALAGGYTTVRLVSKITKETINTLDGILAGILSGIIGGTCLDLFTVVSFKNPDNQRNLIRVLEKNWPKEVLIPDLKEILPSIFFTTCLLIIVVSAIFAMIGGYIGTIVSRKTTKKTN